MIVLGITGGIGAGKSRILKHLKEEYGAIILEADKLAHELTQPGKDIYNRILSEFGEEILLNDESGCIDRAKLSAIVFKDEEKLRLLNNITHPMVKQYILNDIEEKRACGVSLYVIEAALLIEDGYDKICDSIWYVYASEETRIARLMDNRGYSRQKCIDIINSQSGDEYYRKYANFTINNEKNFENSTKQIKVQLNMLL